MNDNRPDNESPTASRDHQASPRRPSGADHEPQINMRNLDLDFNPSPAAAQNGTAREAAHSGTPRPTYSRRHLIMGMGILVLILVIIALAIGSKTESPHNASGNSRPGADKSIDLSAVSGNSSHTAPADDSATLNPGDTQSQSDTQSRPAFPPSAPEIAPPAIASQPVQTLPLSDSTQNRITVQGDLNTALNQPQNNGLATSLPTQAASLTPSAHPPPASNQALTPAPKAVDHKTPAPVAGKAASHPAPRATQPGATRPATSPATSNNRATTAITVQRLKTASPDHFTVQLSSASSDNGLKNLAKKEKLANYVVYKTVRNGQPWYVLVSGIYPSRAAAQHAISTLPASVRAQNPWIKPLRLVQQEIK